MSEYRALICITTCRRFRYLRRYLPHFARFSAQDKRFTLLVSLDGMDIETLRFCEEWEIPLIHSVRREGVGISKNRVLERFPDYQYYFFLEDDVELVDGSVFPMHVSLARASGIHHFSLFPLTGLRKRTGESSVAGRRVLHGLFGAAAFNFFTGAGLEQVGGWHPRFAEYRRWGHTEHSYRFVRAGLAPAPFNVASELVGSCIWHVPQTVTQLKTVRVDADQIAAPERELMDHELRHVPLRTLSPYYFNDASFGRLHRLAATLDEGERYPLVSSAERRKCRSDYQLWRFSSAPTAPRRIGALLAAAWEWPANPMLRHTVKTALKT